jgi:hypothetical protein
MWVDAPEIYKLNSCKFLFPKILAKFKNHLVVAECNLKVSDHIKRF